MMKSYSLLLMEINRDIPRVWPIESSPFRFLILFLARQRIFRFVSPFKFANFSIVFDDNDSLTHALRFVRLASIFSMGGICADKMISSLSLAFNSLSKVSQLTLPFSHFPFPMPLEHLWWRFLCSFSIMSGYSFSPNSEKLAARESTPLLGTHNDGLLATHRSYFANQTTKMTSLTSTIRFF